MVIDICVWYENRVSIFCFIQQMRWAWQQRRALWANGSMNYWPAIPSIRYINIIRIFIGNLTHRELIYLYRGNIKCWVYLKNQQQLAGKWIWIREKIHSVQLHIIVTISPLGIIISFILQIEHSINNPLHWNKSCSVHIKYVFCKYYEIINRRRVFIIIPYLYECL